MFEIKELEYALRKNVNVMQPKRKTVTFGLRSVSYLVLSYGMIILSVLENCVYVFDMCILMSFGLFYDDILMYILLYIARTVYIYCTMVVY